MNFHSIKIYSLTILFTTITSCQKEDYETLPDLEARLYAGGATTVFLTSSNAFGMPAPNLNGSDFELHMDGDFEFNRAFVSAPAQINGGIGPIFNNTSCVSCHPRDGRVSFPSNINGLSGFFLRTSIPGTTTQGGPLPTPGYGTQIQNQAIFGYQPEAKFQVTYSSIAHTLSDGTQVILQKPSYSLLEPYVALPSNAMFSPRLGSPIFGLGLLEAVPESQILAHQDILDADGDGISGKANYVWNSVLQQTTLGRFGWKANTATIIEQCAGAYNGDMGITSTLNPYETGWGQTNGSDALADDPELTQAELEAVTFYTQTLGVPAPRNVTDDSVKRGAYVFEKIDCAQCHIPKMTTGNNTISALRNQTIYPYTDLLVHDMGEELADNRPDFLADGKEWRTRPLWGIGLTQVVNGHTHFLHDGRAKNITEAILWHGGEAENSRDQFKELSTKDREDLLNFLNSL
jgi:CxxC motif-containing protein (DUF1111 family)